MTTAPPQAAIAPLWGNLVVSGGLNSAVYWKVLGTGAEPADDRAMEPMQLLRRQSYGTVDVEAILNADGSIIYNYKNLNTGDYGSGGEAVTVGIKDAGTAGGNRLLVTYDRPAHCRLGQEPRDYQRADADCGNRP